MSIWDKNILSQKIIFIPNIMTPKMLLKKAFILLTAIYFLPSVLRSQPITGTKTVCSSGCDYPTLNSAINALNLNGVGTGGVIIEVTNGHTETIPSAGLNLGSATLNLSLTASNPLVIRKSLLLGIKPIFTSSNGISLSTDAMLKLNGVDYVTIQDLIFTELNTNTSNLTNMEYGIGLFKRNSAFPFDGCQFVTIRNCEIILKRGVTLNTGIYAGNHTGSSTTLLNILTALDAHSNNNIFGNQIINAHNGIWFNGFNQTSSPFQLYDQGNRIGDLVNKNFIIRFSHINGLMGSGIFIANQNNASIIGNEIWGGGIGQTQNLTGINIQNTLQATIRGNVITDTTSSGTNYGIWFSGNTNGRINIDSNTIISCLTTTGIFSGIYTTGTDSLRITRNNIIRSICNSGSNLNQAGITYSGVAAKYSLIRQNAIYGNRAYLNFFGIHTIGLANDLRIINNDVYQDTSQYGIVAGVYQNGSAVSNDSIVGNHIYELVNTNSGTAAGIVRPQFFSNNGGNKYILQNNIHDLKVKLGNVKGIEHNACVGTVWIRANSINGLISDSTNSTINGIEIGTSVANANIINNAISDMQTLYSPIVSTINGIYINNPVAGNISRLYHNTIYLNASNSGNLVSSCVRTNIFSEVEMRNNVLVNRSLAPLNGFTSPFYREGTNLVTYRMGSNNNLFFASGTPGRVAMYTDGNFRDSTMLQYKTRMGVRETQSLQEDLLFSQGITPPYQIYPHPIGATQVESGGNIIDTPFAVHTDINGVPRNRRYPDLGCYEGTNTLLDSIKPQINYPIVPGVAVFMPAPNIQASITDRFGIRHIPSLRPRMYFKKKTDVNSFIANTSASGGWKFVNTSDTINQFNFQVNYALLNSPIAAGDTIQFFIVAQDSNNNTGAGSIGFNAQPINNNLTASAFPVNGELPFFSILDTLSGIYTVGTGGNFNSLTQAIGKINNSLITGPIEMRLINTIYAPVSSGGLEVFPIVLRNTNGATATNNIVIKPAIGMNSLVFGAVDSALIIFGEGTKFVSINGSNNNTNSRNLRFQNTHVNARSIFQFQSFGSNGGIQNYNLSNLILKGGSQTTTQAIFFGTSTGITPASTGKANGVQNIQINNCNIYNCLVGIMAVGSNSNAINQLRIIGNAIGTDSAFSRIRMTGIYLEGATNARIERNLLYNFESNVNTIMTGIAFANDVSNSVIKNNTITGFRVYSTSNSAVYGIHMQSNINCQFDSIYNNSISNILCSYNGSGLSVIFNTSGIRIEGGLHLKVFYNSVHLSGFDIFGYGQNSSAALIINYTGPYTGMDIRNNIFSNTIVNNIAGAKQCAYWNNSGFPLTGSIVNYNNFFVSGSSGFLLSYGLNTANTISDLIIASSSNANSINRNPRFNSISNVMPNKKGNLNIGINIAGLNTDIVDSIRPSSNTRVGCYENEYDLISPVFGAYTQLSNIGETPLVNLPSVQVTDTSSGIDLGPLKRPRIYFRKKTDNNVFGANNSSFNGWKWVELSGNNSPYNASIDYNLLTSITVAGDSIFYFFVAQDSSLNTATLPSIGVSASSVSTIISAPTFPFRYRVVNPPMAGVYRVGSGQVYSTLTAAVNDLNIRGVSAKVTLVLTQANYTNPAETFPIQFNGNITGVNLTNHVQIRVQPGITATINNAGSSSAIVLNGTKHIYINGADTNTQAGRNIIIRSSISGPAVILTSDASSNHIRNCRLYSESLGNSEGIVRFGNRLMNGNDSNWIDSCLIGPLTNSWPSNGISAEGTSGPGMSEGNIISNNEIYNTARNGIGIFGENNKFNIVGNSFYRTATNTSTIPFYFINYNEAEGPSEISNNYFGGTTAYCGGGNTILDGAGSGIFTLLQYQGGTDSRTNIQGNVFRKIQINSISASNLHAFVSIRSGKVNLSNNVIGNDTGNSSIQISYASTFANAKFTGLYVGGGLGTISLDTFWVQNNKIGAIQTIGGGNLEFNCIQVDGQSGIHFITNNLIGSNTRAGSITQNCVGHLYGINIYPNFPNGYSFISNNSISNLVYTRHNSFEVAAIRFAGNYRCDISNNVIRNLFHSPSIPTSVNNLQYFLYGILSFSDFTRSIEKNTIYNLVGTTNPGGGATGIYVWAGSNSNINLSRNKIYAIYNTSYNDCIQRGIYASGTNSIHNNQISLGTDSSGNSITLPQRFIGITKTSGTSKVFFNTVNITGSNVSGTLTANKTMAYYSEVGDITDSVYNNIFINTRSNLTSGLGIHHAVHFFLGTNPRMNNNLLFTNGTNGILANINGTDYSTLPSFAIASSTNSQSRSKQVFFTSPINLKLTGSSIGDTALTALPRAAFGNDIDNEPRDVRKPYMGCDEIPSNPLPVRMNLFEASALNDDAYLVWQTSSEINNKGFRIDRSINGVDFEPIAFVEGNGNSQKLIKYEYLDKNIFLNKSLWYYQLVQTDIDGKLSYLEVKRVEKTDETTTPMQVYPNPVKNQFTVALDQEQDLINAELFALDGKSLGILTPINSQPSKHYTFKMLDVNAGVYLLRLNTNIGYKQIKLIKE